MEALGKVVSLGLFGNILAILSIALAFYFYLKSRRIRRLSYEAFRSTLVGSSAAQLPSEMEIRFAGLAVPRVSRFGLILWNSGNETIEGSSVLDADPLRLQMIGDGRVLRAYVVKASKSVTAAKVEQGEKSVAIRFEFLDPQDGAAIEVIHSGGPFDINIRGTLKSLNGGIQDARPGRRLPQLRVSYSKIATALAAFGAAIALAAFFLPELPSETGSRASTTPGRIGLMLTGGLYVGLAAFVARRTRRRFPASLEPSKEADGRKSADAEETPIID